MVFHITGYSVMRLSGAPLANCRDMSIIIAERIKIMAISIPDSLV